MTALRQLVRRLQLGKKLLAIRLWWRVGPIQQLRLAWAHRKYIPLIHRAKPIQCGQGETEIHMLLHHARVTVGMWALYSLMRFVPEGSRLFVHEDGSFTEEDVAQIKRVFPGANVIRRRDADAKVNEVLNAKGWETCRRFRDNLVFGLKLFDPIVYSQSPRCIIMDSDVLFYRSPRELLESTEPVYSMDNNNSYCLSDDELTSLMGTKPVTFFNPGVFAVKTGSVDFGRFERYLQHPKFWGADGKPSYFGELTLWAMEQSLSGGKPLPEGYRICAPFVDDPATIFGHYCGGGYWASLFYTRGIPYVARQIGLV